MLIEEWGGWHRVRGDEKEEEVLSSLGQTPDANSQERAVRENQLDENEMLETKEEMRGDEQLAQKGDHEKLRKRDVEDAKPVEDEIGAKKTKKKRRGKYTKKRKGKHSKKGKDKHAKKGKQQKKTGPKMKRKKQMCDNKYLEKKRLQLKVKAAKLKEQRSKMKKEKKDSDKRKCPGKEVQEKSIGTSSGGNLTKCIDKWAAFTSLVIGLAPNVIKQVGKLLDALASLDFTLVSQ